MAFLVKRGKTFLVGWHEKVLFNPANPPKTKDGKIPVVVQRAIDAGRAYYSKARWKALGVSTEREARKMVAEFESNNKPARKQTYDDLLFEDAVLAVLEVLACGSGYETRVKHTVSEFLAFFKGRYLSGIDAKDLNRYVKERQGFGNGLATIDRKLTVLRTLYGHFLERGVYKGDSPLKGYILPGVGEASKVREITLEDRQQQALLKACYEPKAHEVFAVCGLEVAKEHEGDSRVNNWLGFGRSPEFHRLLWDAFKGKAGILEGLGYHTDDASMLRLFDHLKYQTQRKGTDSKVLRDIVLLTLTYGLRRGEIVGVPSRVGGLTVIGGGLKVGHWDSKKKALTVMRTKAKGTKGVKMSRWIVAPFIGVMLDSYCEGRGQGEPIFVGTGNNVHSFHTGFVEAVKFAGVEVETIDEAGMKLMVRPQFRDLRHVATCNLLDSGLTEQEVAQILGHKSSDMVHRVYGNRLKESSQQRQAEKIGAGIELILGGQGLVGV